MKLRNPFMINTWHAPPEHNENVFLYWITTHRREICSFFGHLGKFETVSVLCDCGCGGTVDSWQVCVFCETPLPLPESAKLSPTPDMKRHYEKHGVVRSSGVL